MKRFMIFSSLIISFLSTTVFAGPAAAVFCESKIGQTLISQLSMFDISLGSGSKMFKLEGFSRKLGEQPMHFEANISGQHPAEANLMFLDESRAKISYQTSAGDPLSLLSRDDEAVTLGRVIAVRFGNDSGEDGVGHQRRRSGTVVLILKDANVRSLVFRNCHYEGGRVSSWKNMFRDDQ